jgi:hypothetical protein
VPLPFSHCSRPKSLKRSSHLHWISLNRSHVVLNSPLGPSHPLLAPRLLGSAGGKIVDYEFHGPRWVGGTYPYLEVLRGCQRKKRSRFLPQVSTTPHALASFFYYHLINILSHCFSLFWCLLFFSSFFPFLLNSLSSPSPSLIACLALLSPSSAQHPNSWSRTPFSRPSLLPEKNTPETLRTPSILHLFPSTILVSCDRLALDLDTCNILTLRICICLICLCSFQTL